VPPSLPEMIMRLREECSLVVSVFETQLASDKSPPAVVAQPARPSFAPGAGLRLHCEGLTLLFDSVFDSPPDRPTLARNVKELTDVSSVRVSWLDDVWLVPDEPVVALEAGPPVFVVPTGEVVDWLAGLLAPVFDPTTMGIPEDTIVGPEAAPREAVTVRPGIVAVKSVLGAAPVVGMLAGPIAATPPTKPGEPPPTSSNRAPGIRAVRGRSPSIDEMAEVRI
jgi:hypothetical protein